MDRIPRNRAQPAFDKDELDVDHPMLEPKPDAADGPVSGEVAMARIYDAVDALDRRTPDLASHTEVAVNGALKPAASGPAPISAAQGRQLAASARQMRAEDTSAAGGESPWSLTGTTVCLNPQITSPRYAVDGVWKCNVFVGEAFNRAGLSFPLSSVGHYASANSLATRSASFRPVANLNDVRPGDLVTINRRGESGHVEIVTDVARDPQGQVRTITSLGAHEQGLAEGTTTAASLVEVASRAAGQIGVNGVTIDGETFHLLRPMAPAVPVRDLIRKAGPLKG
jgi:hypothetical protein